MPTYRLYQGIAFTTRPLGENPCAVVFDYDAPMLAIANSLTTAITEIQTSLLACDLQIGRDE